MHPKTLITILFIITIQCKAQNKRSPDGLRVGQWVEKYPSGYGQIHGPVVASGNYKIIPANTYDTIRKLDRNCYEVKFKKSTPLLFNVGMKNGNMSVKNGIWNIYNSSGKLERIETWSEGLNAESKVFDSAGNLVSHDYDNYEGDTSFYLTYIDKQLFKTAYYPPENKNSQVEIYYPLNDLIISDAELGFRINFLNNPADTQIIMLSSKKELTIYSITSINQSFSISGSFSPTCYPMKITPETPVYLRLITKPKALTYNINDTILIRTSGDNPPYKIYANTYAAHIDGKNVEVLKELSLSRTKDKYLVVPSLGTVTEIFIQCKSGSHKYYYDIHGITKIDLSDFPLGIFNMEVASCHTGGMMKLIVTE